MTFTLTSNMKLVNINREAKLATFEAAEEVIQDEINNIQKALSLHKEFEETADISKAFKASKLLHKDIVLEDGTFFNYCVLNKVEKNLIIFEYSDLWKIIKSEDLEKHNPNMGYFHKWLGLSSGDSFESILDKCRYRVIDADENDIILQKEELWNKELNQQETNR